MQAAHYPEVPDDFGHWLAGLVDGEGSFYMQRTTDRSGNTSYQCALSVALRDDDRPVLESIARTTGIGLVRTDKERKRAPGSKPRARWHVCNKHDCKRAVAIFDLYPLRAKKARDYAVWREAVLIWCAMRPRSAGGFGRGPLAWSQMARLYGELKDVRAYAAPPPRLQPQQPPALWDEP